MIRHETLEEFSACVLEAAGVTSADARICAQVLVQTDMRGIYSHGTRVLPYLVQHVRGGGVDPKARLEVIREGPAFAVVDGRHGLGHVVAYHSTLMAIERARRCGVGMVGVRRGNHFGAAGIYALKCAMNDMIGLAMCNTKPLIAVTGSSERSIGTNPFAFAAPAGEEMPIVLDIAMSVAAAGKLAILARDGRRAPTGWLVDCLGMESTDPLDFLQRNGALLPTGGHKGFGLAVFVEVLSAVLNGACFTSDVNDWVNQPDRGADEGFSFIAIDIKLFISLNEFKDRIDTLMRRIRGSRKAANVERIYLPGEIEHQTETAARIHGIPLTPGHIHGLVQLAKQMDLENQVEKLLAEESG
jgi:LDH2 family malate/lactate/ureidoglycolate dehydrogenase